MIVLDASVVIELLLGTTAAALVERRISRDPSLHAPGLLDIEVIHAVRRFCAVRHITAAQGLQAVGDLGELPLRRYPHTPLLGRVWELRNNLTAYDASYVALAETLSAPLVTRDRRLASARGHRAEVELL